MKANCLSVCVSVSVCLFLICMAIFFSRSGPNLAGTYPRYGQDGFSQIHSSVLLICLQCLTLLVVRKEEHPACEVLVWLFVRSEVHIACIWSS